MDSNRAIGLGGQKGGAQPAGVNALLWLTPTLLATFLYGVGQGLVKRYAAEVSPARYCLYFVAAKSVVNLGFFLTQPAAPLLAPEAQGFFWAGALAYVLDGTAWILYFESIVAGPITIVGTLSAAYPALTVLFARLFLAEQLSSLQYLGLLFVLAGCLGLSYAPTSGPAKSISRRWVPLAGGALVLWGLAQTLVKHAYALPGAHEANLAVLNTLGGALTLGVYGLWRGRGANAAAGQWRRSALPMVVLAGGDLAVLIATRAGPVSLVTALSGAYPLVTLGFAWLVLTERIGRLQWLWVASILAGMFLSPASD